MNLSIKAKLRNLSKAWKRNRKFYDTASLSMMRTEHPEDKLASNRYEGIAIGLRWAMEDVERVIREHKGKR